MGKRVLKKASILNNAVDPAPVFSLEHRRRCRDGRVGTSVNEGLNSCACHASEGSCESEAQSSLERLNDARGHVVCKLGVVQVPEDLANSFSWWV